MAVECTVHLENGSAILSGAAGSPTAPQTPQLTAAGFLIKSKLLGPSLGVAAGGGANPNVGSGANPNVGSGANPNVGSGANPNVGSGANPNVGSGGQLGAAPLVTIVLGAPSNAERSGPGLPFQIETQEESNWCWAAVSSGVDRYYSPNSYLSQCEIASEFDHADACTFPDDFNQGAPLDQVLALIGRTSGFVSEKLPFEDLQTEIDAGRPVCIRIQWDGGESHFVAICGYQEWSGGLKTIAIADPFYPDSTEDYDSFPSFYHGGGQWAQTYFTK